MISTPIQIIAGASLVLLLVLGIPVFISQSYLAPDEFKEDAKFIVALVCLYPLWEKLFNIFDDGAKYFHKMERRWFQHLNVHINNDPQDENNQDFLVVHTLVILLLIFGVLFFIPSIFGEFYNNVAMMLISNFIEPPKSKDDFLQQLILFSPVLVVMAIGVFSSKVLMDVYHVSDFVRIVKTDAPAVKYFSWLMFGCSLTAVVFLTVKRVILQPASQQAFMRFLDAIFMFLMALMFFGLTLIGFYCLLYLLVYLVYLGCFLLKYICHLGHTLMSLPMGIIHFIVTAMEALVNITHRQVTALAKRRELKQQKLRVEAVTQPALEDPSIPNSDAGDHSGDPDNGETTFGPPQTPKADIQPPKPPKAVEAEEPKPNGNQDIEDTSQYFLN